jgi:hypothetical protein
MHKDIPINQIEEGPIVHPVLPEDLIRRIKAYREILSDVEEGSLAEVVDSFQRDAHPEREIAIWERIAHAYQTFLRYHPTHRRAVKREILSVLLAVSAGMDNRQNVTHLTEEDIDELLLAYKRA